MGLENDGEKSIGAHYNDLTGNGGGVEKLDFAVNPTNYTICRVKYRSSFRGSSEIEAFGRHESL